MLALRDLAQPTLDRFEDRVRLSSGSSWLFLLTGPDRLDRYHAGGQIRCERDASWTTTGSSASRGPLAAGATGPRQRPDGERDEVTRPAGRPRSRPPGIRALDPHSGEDCAPGSGRPGRPRLAPAPAGAAGSPAPPPRRRKPDGVLIQRREQGVLDGVGWRAQLREQGQDEMQDRRIRQAIRTRRGRAAGYPAADPDRSIGGSRSPRQSTAAAGSLRHATVSRATFGPRGRARHRSQRLATSDGDPRDWASADRSESRAAPVSWRSRALWLRAGFAVLRIRSRAACGTDEAGVKPSAPCAASPGLSCAILSPSMSR